MKPWDETWTADWHYDYSVTILRDNSFRVALFNAGGPEGVARAKLAAAAPDMARLLLTLEWSSGDFCPCCGQKDGSEHLSHCEWLAVMRKAGVRP